MLPWLLGRRLLADAGEAGSGRAGASRDGGSHAAATLRRQPSCSGWLGCAARTSRLSMPAFVVAGGEDVLAPAFHAEEVAPGLPRARLEMLEGAGHAVTIERADRVNELVAAFGRKR